MKTYISPYIHLGTVTKTHGTKGEVFVASNNDLPLLLEVGLKVYILPPPLTLNRAVTVEHVNASCCMLSEVSEKLCACSNNMIELMQGLFFCAHSALITLSSVESLSQAEKLVGCKLVAFKEDIRQSVFTCLDILNFDKHQYKVIDKKAGYLGTAKSLIQPNEMQLCLEVSGVYQDLSIPCITDLIEFNNKMHEFHTSLPEGYLNLYKEAL